MSARGAAEEAEPEVTTIIFSLERHTGGPRLRLDGVCLSIFFEEERILRKRTRRLFLAL